MRISLLLLFISLTFGSCSEYQKVLRSDDITLKYSAADSLYEAGKYKKALKLMEQIVPSYRGKPQAEKLMFRYANTIYKLEDYLLSGYQFERFETSYPNSDSIELAAYRGAKSYYQLSPRYSLDQKDTYKALESMQAYINKYPNSENRIEANILVSELRGKIEKKDYEVAKQYFNISDYKAAIEAFDNFIGDHPGSRYRKDAFYGRLEAAYQLAIKSIPSLVNERLITAKGYYDSFMKYYKDTDLRKDADEILEDMNKRLKTEEPTS